MFELDYSRLIISILNFTLLIVIIFGVYKAIKGFRRFILRNKEMDKKLDIILNVLEKREDKTDAM